MPELFDYQRAGGQFLADRRFALLADDMGLGKSAQAVHAADLLGDLQLTIVCPAIMVREWLQTLRVFGDVPRLARAADPAANVCVISYDKIVRNPDALAGRRGRWILDESHYVKEPTASRTKALLGRRGLARNADSVWFLTGTPVPNNVGELYTTLAASGRYVGNYHSFLARYAKQIETPYGSRIIGHQNTAELRGLLNGFMLRRLNSVELPATDSGEIVVEPREIDPAARVLAQLAELEPQAATAIAGAVSRQDFSDLDTPFVATMRRLTGLAKAAATADKAAALLTAEPDSKIVLFGLHTAVLGYLAEHLADFNPVMLAGGISDAKRAESIRRFQCDAGVRVAVCQMKAAGTGLTLTAANHLWIVEPSWTPADNQQAARRIVRIGQKRRTSVKYVSLISSIDQQVNAVLQRKQQVIDEIMQI